jgi:hypothetical protein
MPLLLFLIVGLPSDHLRSGSGKARKNEGDRGRPKATLVTTRQWSGIANGISTQFSIAPNLDGLRCKPRQPVWSASPGGDSSAGVRLVYS